MSKPVALITGGSMGLGLAVANRMAQTHDVSTCARDLQNTTPRGLPVTYRCDVSNVPDVEWMVDSVFSVRGRIDVLVCNAAIYGPVAQLDTASLFDWDRTIQINVMGTMLPCRAVLPIMRAQGHGKIITLSGGGVTPNKGTTAYNTSKGAVLRFTEALAHDLEGTGIDVNAVAPGTLDTRMRNFAKLPADPKAAMQKAVDLIAWLASPASDGITGRLFSAVWDDVGNLPKPLGPDDYRMRRVVPANVLA